MRRHERRIRPGTWLAVAMVVGSGCAAGPGTTPAESIVAEAKSFMEGYDRELVAGEVERIVARYDTTGVHLLGNGTHEALSHDSVAKLYRSAPPGMRPESFEWGDLTYQPLGPDAVVVAGTFTMRFRGTPSTVAYSSLLRRQNGALRIQVEHESTAPVTPPPAPGRDSTSVGVAPSPPSATATPAERVVMRQVDAYNRRDLEAFLATYAPDVRWYSFPDTLGGSGIEATRAIFARMFAQEPNLRAEIRGKIVRGNYVILDEHVTGLRSGVPIDEVVIYEVKGEKITQVWFLR